MAPFYHTTIESMSAKALISALNYYNSTIFNKNTFTFTMFVERCVEENPETHHINVHYNSNAEGELSKYGVVDADGNLITVEQADNSFNAVSTVEHAFYNLYSHEEKKIVDVLNKAIAAD